VEVGEPSLVLRTSASLFFMDRRALKLKRVTPEDVADYLSSYTIKDNTEAADTVPRAFRDRVHERVFAAVFPGRRMDDVARCLMLDSRT
jgi:hypothetical protein